MQPNTALVTGASSGIGMELARICAREGHNLLLTARREQRLMELKNELETEFGVDVMFFTVDLAEHEAPPKLFEFVQENAISVQILVNNAGVGDYGFFHESDWNRQAAMLDLNIRALTHLTHLILPEMIKQNRAYILNVASTAAFQPGPLMSVYYATKSYVLSFGEAIANELQDTGVTVTTLCPGPTESEFQKEANMEKSKLFDRFPVATSKEIAEYGYKTMIKGKRVAIYGLINKFIPKAVGISPRSFVTRVARFIQQRKD